MLNKKRVQMRKWLNRYRFIKKELEARQKHIEDFIRDTYNPLKAICSDGQPRGKGTTSDQTYNTVVHIERTYFDIIREMQNRVEVLQRALHEIEQAIDSLSEYESCVLYHRFVLGIHWADLPAYVGYEQRQCTRYEASGLDKLIKNMANNDKL